MTIDDTKQRRLDHITGLAAQLAKKRTEVPFAKRAAENVKADAEFEVGAAKDRAKNAIEVTKISNRKACWDATLLIEQATKDLETVRVECARELEAMKIRAAQAVETVELRVGKAAADAETEHKQLLADIEALEKQHTAAQLDDMRDDLACY